jgi:hypothetical protein
VFHALVIGLAMLSFGCSEGASRSPATGGERSEMFRMTIKDTFNIRTRRGPVVLGKIEAGVVRVGDELVLASETGRVTVRVEGIEKFQQSGLQVAEAGEDDVGLELSGVAYADITTGDVLTSRHETGPVDSPLPFDHEAFIERIRNSEYYKQLLPLQDFVRGSRVVGSEAGNSGFILLLDRERWAAAYRDGTTVAFAYGEGEPTDSARGVITSSSYGNATEPIDSDRPYASERCDIAEQVSRSHGGLLSGLAIGVGESEFNYAFDSGHELDVSLVNDKEGRPAVRVFWEQW